MAERIEFVRERLARCFYRSEVVKALRKKFGLDTAQANRAFTRAQEELWREYYERGMEDWRVFSVEFYRSVLNSELASMAEKIKAMNRIDRVLGLEKPVTQKVQVVTGLEDMSEEQVRDRAAMQGLPVYDGDNEPQGKGATVLETGGA